jgi:hypothetical protein
MSSAFRPATALAWESVGSMAYDDPEELVLAERSVL